jgi:hypothetical protein
MLRSPPECLAIRRDVQARDGRSRVRDPPFYAGWASPGATIADTVDECNIDA